MISDFDTFTVGSKGMTYAPLPSEQLELVNWSLNHTETNCFRFNETSNLGH